MNKVIAVLGMFLAGFAYAGTGEVARAVFSEVERQIIREYYRDRYGAMEREHDRYTGDHHGDHDNERGATGKGKGHKAKGRSVEAPGRAGSLPPGIQMKLARGGQLPPGIAKNLLPDDLSSRLPPTHPGYARHEVDGRVVLVEVATGIIVDIIRHADLFGAEPAPTPGQTSRDQRTVRYDDRTQVPEPERAPVEEKSWWEFWKR